jgi:hypothetical protein
MTTVGVIEATVRSEERAAATAKLKRIVEKVEYLGAEGPYQVGWNDALDAVLRAWKEDRDG